MKTFMSRWLQRKPAEDTTSANDNIRTTSLANSEPTSPVGKRLSLNDRRQSAENSTTPEGITIEQRLAAGSFGKVYTGRWHGVQVALKVIRHDASSTAQISNEVSLAKRMDHPNIIGCFHFTTQPARPDPRIAATQKPAAASPTQQQPQHPDSATDVPESSDKETWIVQELCTGGSLDKFIKAGGLMIPGSSMVDMNKLLVYALDIARGMAHLHSHSICHGDLKAANVLMASAHDKPSLSATSGASTDPETPTASGHTQTSSASQSGGITSTSGTVGNGDGTGTGTGTGTGVGSGSMELEPRRSTAFIAKVADFGLSRAMAGNRTHVTTFTYGTLAYMPPELLSHGQLRLSVDVYSFAIILWEMLVGSPPYQGLLDGQIIHAVVVERFRPPLPPWTPHEYASLCEACWNHEQDSRPGFPDIVTRLELLLMQVEELQAQIEEWIEDEGEGQV